jgi:hypothetical protein
VAHHARQRRAAGRRNQQTAARVHPRQQLGPVRPVPKPAHQK